MSFYTIDLLIISIWFFVINGFYIGMHFYKERKQSEAQLMEENRLLKEGLMVKAGKKEYKLDFLEICGLYVDGDYVVAVMGRVRNFTWIILWENYVSSFRQIIFSVSTANTSSIEN